MISSAPFVCVAGYRFVVAARKLLETDLKATVEQLLLVVDSRFTSPEACLALPPSTPLATLPATLPHTLCFRVTELGGGQPGARAYHAKGPLATPLHFSNEDRIGD